MCREPGPGICSGGLALKHLHMLWPLAAGLLILGLDSLFPYGYALWPGYLLILILIPIRTAPGLYAAAFAFFAIGGFKSLESLGHGKVLSSTESQFVQR